MGAGRIPCNACTRLATNAAFASTRRTNSFESAIETHTQHNYIKYKMSWHRQPTASPTVCGHPHTGSGTQPPQLSTGAQGCLLSPPTHGERHAATTALHRRAGLSSVATHTRGTARSHHSSPQARRVVFSHLRQCRLSANPTSDTSCRGRARSGSGERRRQMFGCATALTLYSVTRQPRQPCKHRQNNYKSHNIQCKLHTPHSNTVHIIITIHYTTIVNNYILIT